MSEIKKIVEEIQNSSIKNKEEYFSEKYPEFKQTNPVIFQVACEKGLDMKKFGYMLEMLEKIKNEKISQDQASTEVGQMLFKEYVEPKVPLMK